MLATLSKRNRLDRFISAHTGVKKKDIRLLLAQNRVQVNGDNAKEIGLIINEFDHVVCDGIVLQANRPIYVMLHKPIGVISATKDEAHQTALDLLTELSAEIKQSLHIVGRLDLNTSGLLLLTNDSRWSQTLMRPESKVSKVYQVTLRDPLTVDYIEAFAKGMYFAYEDITTLPAKLEILAPCRAQVTLMEGRYHQIKRMFGRFRNPVLALHRQSVGGLQLDNALKAGESRLLTDSEVQQALWIETL